MEIQYYGQDELRQCCGGAGFQMNSGIAMFWADSAAAITFEGVPVVMY
jgi:alkylation response protein AidB-like acyl-CoA dehydrogenase